MLGVFNGFGSRMISRGVLVASALLLLSACGGGGGGGGTPPLTTNKPVANAGADLIVNSSDRIDLDPKVLVSNVTTANLSTQGLELKGSSENKEAIVGLVWSKIEGPDFAIASSGFNDGKIHFIAPSTNGASSIKISFKLTVTNAAGLSAEDTITITVNRVNQAPIANAGADQSIDDSTEVNLNGSLSTDPDGSIAKYQWNQVSGANVTLVNPTKANASFLAPAVETETVVEFELSVEDAEGKSAKDRVVVLVRPSAAPRVELYFPTKNAIYTANTLSVFGGATAKDATISAVTVDLGTGPVAAVVKADGSWRLDNLAVPSGGTEFSIKIDVVDSLGRKGQSSSIVKKSTKNTVGTGQDWDDIVGISVDSETNKLWLISSAAGAKPTRLLSIDLNNGNRSVSVSDFSNKAQGVSSEALTQLTFDAVTKSVFVSVAPAASNALNQILRIDTLTGNRTLISDKTRGSGSDLTLPYGISASASGELFVADNRSNSILSINVATGDRTVVADTNTAKYAIDAPLFVAADNKSTPKRLFVMPNSTTTYLFELDLTQQPAVSRLVTGGSVGEGDFLFGTMKGIAIDNKNNKVFAMNSFGSIYSIEIATGNRKELASISSITEGVAFDEKRGLLYVIDDLPETLYAVDTATGRTAIVSKASDF